MAEDYTAADVDEALEEAAGEASLLAGQDLPMTAFHHRLLADQVRRVREALHALVDTDLAAVALTGYTESGQPYCVYCQEGETDVQHHTADCPVQKARALLTEKGEA